MRSDWLLGASAVLLACGARNGLLVVDCPGECADASPEDSGTDAARIPTGDAAPDCDLDSDGHASVACGGDDCDDGDPGVSPSVLEIESWQIEPVGDPAESGVWPSLAVQPDGTELVAYCIEQGEARVATRLLGVWTVETAARLDGRWCTATSIALSWDGAVHVAFVSTAGSLYYATNAGGEWLDAILLKGCAGAALAADPGVGTYVACTTPDDGLLLAEGRDGSWSMDAIDRSGVTEGGDGPVSMAIDQNGFGHIAYGARPLRYATNSRTTAWELDGVTGNSRVFFAALAVRAGGDPQVVYQDSDRHLAVASIVDGLWADETIDSSEWTGFSPSIALDGDGAVHVAYYDIPEPLGDPRMIRHASNASGQWAVGTIAEDDVVAGGSGIGIDAAGILHVAYDGVNELRIARRSLPNGTDDDCDGQAY